MESVYVDQHYNLVVECKRGTRKAQYELYKLYSKAMYNVAVRILKNEAEAADVLQEAFFTAFKQIGDFRQDTTFGLWIKQIVVNKSITQLRKRKIDFISLDDPDLGEVAEPEDFQEEEMEYKVQQVKQAVTLLPDHYRVVFSLYYLEGYDHEEIAQILKISENTSRTQCLRAKRKLIEILKNKTDRYER